MIIGICFVSFLVLSLLINIYLHFSQKKDDHSQWSSKKEQKDYMDSVEDMKTKAWLIIYGKWGGRR